MSSEFVKNTTGVTAYDKTCLTNGLTAIVGGAGISDMTIGSPKPGHKATIRLVSASGPVIVTAATGTTLDGTHTIATFSTAEQALELVYNGDLAWEIKVNTGAVIT